MDAKQREFLFLRADGVSFDKIAKQLKTTKSTLIQWSKLYENEIKELQFHALAELKTAYMYNIKTKYETLLKQINKIDDAILEADISNTQIKDLFTIKQNLNFEIENIEKKINIKSNVVTTNYIGEREDIPMKLSDV